ncbi:MAG: arginine decarboxylase [Bacteroidetes bacterium]|nr:arginine decarboxylase [Bacteroidota bacterium]
MRNRYIDLIKQTYYFPQDGFNVVDNYLQFHNINLKELIDEYGTPLKISYLPKIANNIERARKWFHDAFENVGYNGNYHYCYCTKSSHFSFVMEEVLRNGAHLETSSGYDIDLIRHLHQKGLINKKIRVICNGYKPKNYIEKIKKLIHDGFKNVIPVMDNMDELSSYLDIGNDEIGFGLRIATEEEPNYQFYTSRLGIRYEDIIPFYVEKIKPNPQFHLRMLHFFIDSGIKDTAYYWNELMKCLNVYAELKKLSPGLAAINIGGGLPIRTSLGNRFDYAYVIEEVVTKIANFCDEAGVEHPNIYTEFGNFTVGESGAVIFEVIGEKKQNDSELWYMIDGSLMTTLPDVWGMNQRFILLPINNWHHEYHRTNIGGLSCDVGDYYNSEVDINQVYMPKTDGTESQYIGFFHTGAYQDSISGYGGTKHCLIPAPKHLVISTNDLGETKHELFADQQQPDEMLRILGYK